MKKQILSLMLCICMILALTPAFATTQTAPTACNVLFEEDFEDGESSLTVYDNTMQVEDDETDVFAISQGAEYGQGNYALLLKNDDKNVQRTSFGITTDKLQNGTDGYVVEVNFDWNPYVSSANNIVRITSNPTAAAEWNASNMSSTVSLYLIENGETQTLTINDRGNNTVLDSEDLVTKIGAHVTNPDHVYRVRVVIAAKASTQVGATISVYFDDILMKSFENPWASSNKDRYLCGFQIQHTKILERGTFDNIKVVEYGTGVAGEDSYINDDALVTAIRRCESNLTSAPENNQAAFSTAIATAKAAFEAESRTQASIDAATAALEAAEAETFKVYQYEILHEENFENAAYTPFNVYDIYIAEDKKQNSVNQSVVAAITDLENDGNYALGNQWYQLQTTDTAGLVYQFANPSGNIRADETNIANNYKTELSFDYKMPTNFSPYILINTNNASGEFLASGKIFQLNMNPTTGIAYLRDRNDITVATFNLMDYAKGADFANEVNRFRFVFAPTTPVAVEESCTGQYGETYAGILTLYINGIKVCEVNYVDLAKESTIAGMTIKSSTDNAGESLGYIDNIELIDYDDTTLAIANSVPYDNTDKLVAAKRGGWNALVSNVAGKTVTIKAIDAIPAGKIIVANYSGTRMLDVALPEFTGLAAGQTKDVTVPDGWTGEVRVFFWDTDLQALMLCETLNIQ